MSRSTNSVYWNRGFSCIYSRVDCTMIGKYVILYSINISIRLQLCLVCIYRFIVLYDNYDAHTHTAKHIHTYTNNHTKTDVFFDYLRSSSDRLQIQIYTLIEKQIQILHLWIATIQLSYTAIALFASFHILATLLSLSAYIDMYSIVVYRYIYSTRSKNAWTLW